MFLVAEQFLSENPWPQIRKAMDFLRSDAGVHRGIGRVRIQSLFIGPPKMRPAKWPVPVIETAGALAEWLWIAPGELDWFANLRAMGHGTKLDHYVCTTLPKRSGGVRIIESPKPRLKKIQRQILTEILDRIPTHDAAHGCVRGRSIRTFAAPHVGRSLLMHMDLSDFFPSIRRPRIAALFRTAGYPESVAELLAGLCTKDGHLPQGAPTSPALANLCAYRSDCRLAGLAKTFNARYTRYVDDLAFSGNLQGNAKHLAAHASTILTEEGFAVHFRKTRAMRSGVRQRITGLVVNQKLNLTRESFDLLKATLMNCVRYGPATQNRLGIENYRAHLEGKVAFAESIHPGRGEKLRNLLSRILWTAI